jgi:hypothetical protein
MDANNPNKDHRTTPEYAEYQRDNFWASNDGNVPPFNTGSVQPKWNSGAKPVLIP